MIQNFALATGCNEVAIPLAGGIGAPRGIILLRAVGAALVSASTVLVAINDKLFGPARKLVHRLNPGEDGSVSSGHIKENTMTVGNYLAQRRVSFSTVNIFGTDTQGGAG